MDSHLSNAQRCARKADSLVKYGMYDEALGQLDKSISYLYELKSFTTRYENIQMLNVQIESIDRKKRSVAIRRSESIKKKNRIENMIGKAKQPLTIQQVPVLLTTTSTKPTSAHQKQINKCDQSPVIIEYCFNNDNVTINTKKQHQEAMLIHSRKKLDKDDKSIIEELSTTNAEYKKVNSFLADEIAQLKRENDQLKVELIKVHMSDSLTSSDSSVSSIDNNQASSSTPKPHAALHRINNNNSMLHTVSCFNVVNNQNHSQMTTDQSSGESSTSSSNWSISTNSANSSHMKEAVSLNSTNVEQNNNQKIGQFKSIDLSRYIDDDEDDYFHDSYQQQTDEDSYELSENHPPFEFTVDSV